MDRAKPVERKSQFLLVNASAYLVKEKPKNVLKDDGVRADNEIKFTPDGPLPVDPMNKKDLSERDIYTNFITPAIKGVAAARRHENQRE